jgi:Ca2+-binding EF-hand superfamily protein
VFDKDMSGFVSSSELKFVMSNLGVNFTDEELLEMMIEVTFLPQFNKLK